MTAYLILHMELRAGVLVPTRADIYTSDPMNLTSMQDETGVTVLEWKHDTFEGARGAIEKTLESLASYRPGYAVIKALYDKDRR